MDSYLILILCIVLNALISVVFKLFERYKIDTLQAITVNYLVCFTMAAVVMGTFPIPANVCEKTWLPHAIFMGFLFISIFTLTALTVRYFGVVVAVIFQKMSLIAPALMAILVYGESSGVLKWAGIGLALVAILLLSLRKESPKLDDTAHRFVWLFPILTFAGSCVIDAGLFLIEHHGLAASSDASFIATLFVTAGLTGLCLQLPSQESRKKMMAPKNWLAGIALGVPNFFSIHLLLVALNMGWEGSKLFPINNTGILLLSTAFGIVLFRESMTRMKIAGIIIAILAIILISTG